MGTVQGVFDSVEIHIRDSDNDEVSEAQLLILLNDAVNDAGNSGWMIPIEDAAITVVEGAVAVPASFVFIKDIRITATAIEVARHYWRIEVVGGSSSFVFEPSVRPTGAATVYGWRRPTVYSAVGDTLDPSLESFLRDRMAAYALGFMAAGGSELDRTRLQSRELKMRDSEALLERKPQQYKVLPLARYVPER